MTPPLTLADWTGRLNQYGKEGTPCFFILDFERRLPRVWSRDAFDPALFRFDFPGRVDNDDGTPVMVEAPSFLADPPAYADYLRAFDTVRAGLSRGDSYLTNLTWRVAGVLTGGDLLDVYRWSRAKYRVWLADRFACFSPETFVSISAEGYLETRPMKGTAPDTPADRSQLLTDPKEIAEHATIVDLLRNDLSRVARGVRVTDYRYLRAIEAGRGGLVQTSSRIGGQLSADWPHRLGDLLAALTPAGSVSGAPKTATLALIRRAEQGPRGYYCGVAGYFDGRSLDSCVLIRYLEREGDRCFFRTGGGITALSDPLREYAELLSKVRIPTSTSRKI